MKHNFWNLIACLKNGSLAKKASITHVNKKLNKKLLTILWDKGYIAGYQLNKKTTIKVFLKYTTNTRKPAFKKIYTISKPGKRIYYSAAQLWKMNSTNSFLILSTNKGLKSIDECRKLKIGGEPLIVVY